MSDWISAADAAKQIRKALKAHDKTWNAKAISVRSENYSMGSSIRVSIKRPGISLEIVEQIATAQQSIRRDQFGEILSGGNRYVSVDYTRECKNEIAAPHIKTTRAAIVRSQASITEGTTGSTIEAIESAPGVFVSADRTEAVVWTETGGESRSSGRRIWCDESTLSAIAFAVAEALPNVNTEAL